MVTRPNSSNLVFRWKLKMQWRTSKVGTAHDINYYFAGVEFVAREK